MARRTKAQIQEEVAAASEAREKAYFEAQTKSKAGATAIAPDLPAADAYRYSYSWKQDPGAPTGELTLIKNPNQYYDSSTNEIVDPATGKRTPATQSMWSGPTTFRGDVNTASGLDIRDPITGLTPAQIAARAEAEKLAAQLGAKIDPKTGFIDKTTIDPAKAAAWYAASYGTTSQPIIRGTGTTVDPFTINGQPFTGVWQGKSYQNGILITPTSSTDSASSSGSTSGTTDANAAFLAQQAADAKKAAGQSAYNLLFEQFSQYGLGALVEPLKDLIVQGLSQAEFTLRLRDTDAYKKRFAANQQRIAKGLRALSEAEYIGLEDQYQDVMRRYGLPETYYTRGDMGRQEGFEKFIGGDVSPVELEDRIQTAQNRVLNAPTQIKDALSQFYGGEISNGDILAYVLDPTRALSQIQRKITAAEIGGAAAMAGLATGRERAEELGRFGVTSEQARQGFSTIAEFLPSAQKLSDIYRKQGLGDFTQATAEQEVFGITGAAEAAAKRKKLTQLEQAQFAGQVGTTGGALSRERAGQF